MTETVLMGNLAIRSYMLRDKNTKEFYLSHPNISKETFDGTVIMHENYKFGSC